MHSPPLFRDRPRPVQVILGGVVPVLFGAIVGILVGVSSAAYWGCALLAAVGAFLSGFEHRDGWGGADRGFFGGLFYGIALRVTHALVGTPAKVSLGGAVGTVIVTTIAGMLLAAAGGRIARWQRERAGIFITDEHLEP